jgi:multidrug efflux system membrane fusion protein
VGNRVVISGGAPRRAVVAALLASMSSSGMLALAGCHRPPPAAAPPAVVVAAAVHPESRPGGEESIRYPVEVAARYSNTMSFRVAGKLLERRVRLGDRVRKGEVVARLDAIDAQKQSASAQAALDAADHRLIFAKQQLERDQAQFAQNLIATNQLEQTQDAYAAALAAHDQSAAQRIVALNALAYTILVAEHDGVITSENADTGQVVAVGQAIYGLAWTGDTDVDLDAAAADLGRMAIGQSARVAFQALPGSRFDARVREIAPAADPQSRTYRVKLSLLQPGQAVRLGMTGDAILSPLAGANGAPLESTFAVPATAIFHQGKTPAVWVIRADSIVELHPVTVRSYGERSVTVTGGLKDGDRIVLAGVHTVYAGQHVNAVEPLFAADAESDATASHDSREPGAGGAAGLREPAGAADRRTAK